jgi:methionyl aminopeptidase
VSIDVGAACDGFTGDCSATFPVGRVSEEAQRLVTVTRACFYEGLKYAVEGANVLDISLAIQLLAEANGYSVVRTYTGHGVGRTLHEEPEVPSYRPPGGRGPRIRAGMTLAIEPMVNSGCAEVEVLQDGWTVVTADRRLCAHYEHTVLITRGMPELLTKLEECG